MRLVKLRCVWAVATREVDWKCSPLLSIKALATYIIAEQCWKCCIIGPQSVFLCFLQLSELLPHSQKAFPEAFLCFLCCVPCVPEISPSRSAPPASSYTLANLQSVRRSHSRPLYYLNHLHTSTQTPEVLPQPQGTFFFWGFEISLVVLFFPQISLAAVDITISLVHPAKRLLKNYANTLMDEEDHLKTKHIKAILVFHYMNMKTRWSFSFPYCSSQITFFFMKRWVVKFFLTMIIKFIFQIKSLD